MDEEAKPDTLIPTSTHWGNYLVEKKNNDISAIRTYQEDEEPSDIGQSLLDYRNPDVRIAEPMVRLSYLNAGRAGGGALRGKEPFVPVSWEKALDLAASAISEIKKDYSNEAIYGGSYGWASAGRFHHAQSQIHRFLRTCGGYVDSRDDYSSAAAWRIVPYFFGRSFYEWATEPQSMEDIVEHSGCLVLFGGAALKNTEVNAGGLGAHNARRKLSEVREAGVKVYNISPLRDDAADESGAEWLSCIPNSDVAIMLAITHSLVDENLQDQAFLDKYTEGWNKFLPYLMGETDGQAKNADWAASLSGVDTDTIRELARTMAAERSVISVSWSLQRQQHGEQSYWMAAVLAAALGHIGLPGGGITFGYGCIHNIGFGGRELPPYSTGALPQGQNPVDKFIPVARIADMLLHPGEPFDYDGNSYSYPDIKLIYWAGGNPFHHHQDLNRLRKAWTKPETIIVNESVWTATARHADIVFPVNTMLERNDMSGGGFDNYLTPMPKVIDSYAESRSDYEIFSELAERLGVGNEFTEGLDEMAWVKRLYQVTRDNAAEVGIQTPEFDDFWSGQQFNLKDQYPPRVWPMEKFRDNPDTNPLTTPSGKIEIFSETINGYNYDDCGGHPFWFDKDEWLGSDLAKKYPLHLNSNQPKKKLHSQLDFGRNSRDAKAKGREIVRMHPQDASDRNIKNGDVVRLFNDRGACLASAQLTDRIRPRVIELPTGSWYDPEDPKSDDSLEVHGNPNVLTRDKGTSKLAQGPTAHSCLVEMELYTDPLPPIKVFNQPEIKNQG